MVSGMTRQKGRAPQPKSSARSTAPPVPTKSRAVRDREAVIKRRLVTAGIVFFSATGLAAATLGRKSVDHTKNKKDTTSAALPAGCTEDQKFDDGRSHVPSPTYTVDPPDG